MSAKKKTKKCFGRFGYDRHNGDCCAPYGCEQSYACLLKKAEVNA